MKINKSGIVVILAMLVCIVVLTITSNKPEAEVIQQAKEAAETTFMEEDNITPTVTFDKFSLYLPEKFTVDEETDSNLVLSKDDQLYLLFYNPLESETSKLNFQSVQASGNALLLESFTDENRFGYVMIRNADDEQHYELQIGVGSVKITTITRKEELVGDAEAMMKMANSIAYES